MLRSSNPILSKQDAFTPAAPQQYGQNPYGQQSPYAPQQPGYGQPPVGTDARMTFDDVITKTALVMGVLVVSAAIRGPGAAQANAAAIDAAVRAGASRVTAGRAARPSSTARPARHAGRRSPT